MGVKNVKLGATLAFDDVREKDIIEKVDYLLSRHKLGEFISHLIRIALESPEQFNSKNELNMLMGELMEKGISKDRAEYFRQMNAEVQSMKKKVDSIYEMAYKNYTMALLGKTLGIGEKSENSLRAQFVLQRQLTQLSETLGTSIKEPFESNKIQDVKGKADEILEYILESYDGIVQELRVPEVRVVDSAVIPEPKVEDSVDKEEKVLEIIADDEEDEKVISFETEYIDELSGFFGEG